MKYKKRAGEVQPISRETLEKGRQFVEAMVADGHSYNSMKVHFGYLIAMRAVEGKKLRSQMSQAAVTVQMNRNQLRRLLLLRPQGQEPFIQVPRLSLVYE